MQIGILGLGKMGTGLMEKLLKEGHDVAAWNKSKDVYEQLKIDKSDFVVNQKLKLSFSIEGLRETLVKPRVFWLMLQSTEETESILPEIMNIAEQGDIIIDGGNTPHQDTQRRYEEFTNKNFKFLGIGLSDDVRGVEDGFSIMAGGNKDGYDYIQPALESLSLPYGGFNFFGEGGAGHYVKMVHDGIEYGLMQTIGEGIGILAHSPYNLNIFDAAAVWQKGSVVRSYLLDMTLSALNDPEFINSEGLVEEVAKGKRIVETAHADHLPVTAIDESLKFRLKTQYDKAAQNTVAAKLVAILSKQFSG